MTEIERLLNQQLQQLQQQRTQEQRALQEQLNAQEQRLSELSDLLVQTLQDFATMFNSSQAAATAAQEQAEQASQRADQALNSVTELNSSTARALNKTGAQLHSLNESVARLGAVLNV